MKKRYVVVPTIMVIIVGALFFRWTTQPAVTHPANSPNVQGAESPDYSLKPYHTDYFYTQIPKRFSIKTTTKGQGRPTLLQELFTATGDSQLGADQLAVEVATVPIGGLSEVSAVQYRERTSLYSPQTYTWLSGGARAFLKDDTDYELGIFSVHDDRYISIVISGMAGKHEQLQHELQLVYESIVWR